MKASAALSLSGSRFSAARRLPAASEGGGGLFFKFFFAFSLLACYASTPDVRGPSEMTNPNRRQIQEHPACDTHRPRPHAEGFLRRSGREVECTPLLRVQVRIRASGVRIPPSPPVSEQGSEPSSGLCFFRPLISFRNCERFCVTLRPRLHPEANCHWRDITKNTWSCARAFSAREHESGTVFLAKWNDRRSSWNGLWPTNSRKTERLSRQSGTILSQTGTLP